MANTDRPNGFRPRKNLLGAPWQGLMRKANMTANATDIFMYDPLEVDGTGAVAAAEGSAQDEIVGVAAGFGRFITGTMGQDATETDMNFDPSSLEAPGANYLDASAITNAEFVVFFYPAYGVLYEAQTASDLELDLFMGAAFSNGGGGSTETGISTVELNAETVGTEADVIVIENAFPPGEDDGLNAKHLVAFVRPVGLPYAVGEDAGAIT